VGREDRVHVGRPAWVTRQSTWRVACEPDRPEVVPSGLSVPLDGFRVLRP